MANGGPSSATIDAVTKVVTQLGFPAVVAGVLLWFLLTRFQDNMNLITGRMEHNAEAVESFVSQLKTQTDELRLQTVELKSQTGLMVSEVETLRRVEQEAAALVKIRQRELGGRPAESPQ
jgi:hypothetical protein